MNTTFARMEEGFSNALREYNKKQILQLNALINLLLGELNDQDRQKITTLCLIDLHARDVVAKMLNLKVSVVLPIEFGARDGRILDRE